MMRFVLRAAVPVDGTLGEGVRQTLDFEPGGSRGDGAQDRAACAFENSTPGDHVTVHSYLPFTITQSKCIQIFVSSREVYTRPICKYPLRFVIQTPAFRLLCTGKKKEIEHEQDIECR